MFEGSRPQFAFCTRSYYLHPHWAGPLKDWPPQFKRIADLGFDHVLVPLPAVSNQSVWLIDDLDRPHPALGAAGNLSAVLRQIGDMARHAGLTLLIDLALDRVSRDGAYARQHADWLIAQGEADTPDPRRAAGWQDAAALRLDDPSVVDQLVDEWLPRLRDWQSAGVAGYLLQSPASLPASLIAPLIAGLRETGGARFIAATVGLAWDQHAKLAGVGYDAVLGSGAGWDFRGDWLIEEHRRLSQIAPVITAPEDAFGPRVASRQRQAEQAPRSARRLLRLAAGSGCGWLMPMGFEFGARDPLPLCGGSPAAFASLRQDAPYDLSAEIADINRWLAQSPLLQQPARLVATTGAGHRISTLLRTTVDPRDADEGLLIATNTSLATEAESPPAVLLGASAGGLSLRLAADAAPADEPAQWSAGELRYYPLTRPQPVLAPTITRTRRSVETALKWPRVSIEAITPSVDGGQHLVKRVVGDVVEVEADAFMDGHDVVAVALLWRPADESNWREVRMRALGNDRWAGEFSLQRLGRHLYTVQAWRDDWQSYRHEIEKKHAARLKIDVELTEGLHKLESAAAASADAELSARLRAIAQSLTSADTEARITGLMSEPTASAMRAADVRPFAAINEPALIVDAEPTAARFAAWYELFPRSMSFDPDRHGTLRDVIGELPRIRKMGFDVLYFPPIHPIGRKHRKGRNNSLTATPEDPGSPYAIGSDDGGYEAVDPRLGTLEDFRALRDAARENGLQLALDFAIQCAPDHPWLREHPDWFAWRPDGTIKYAENPPKKYEDIVNVDFYAEGAMPGLWLALRDAVLFWCNEGVRCFRVDNPHTKPLPFWKWMIADVRGRYPDAVFLAEAFTRPKLMRRLAKVGYSQSYTYFTWRNTKAELTEYLTELTQTEMREYFRPHFFVNTPDINPLFLQTSGRAGFVIRAVLATTLSGLWGMYSGFELCEAAALPNKEEYLDSEKYQIRVWDWQRPGHITHEITLLNRLRRQHPALQTHLGLSFVNCWNESVLLYCKATPDRSDVLLIAVNLDPHNAQEADFELPLWDFGLPDHGALAVDDRVNGARFTWQGKIQHLRLTPQQPFAIWRLSASD